MNKLFLLNQRVFVTTPLSMRSISRWRRASVSSKSSSALNLEGGVSMVQGASRGIGLEFVKQLLEKEEKWHVIATCRNPDAATGLLYLKNKFSERLSIQRLDLTLESTIEASANSIRETFGSLNLLINASGILSIPDVLHPGTARVIAYIRISRLVIGVKICSISSDRGPELRFLVPGAYFFPINPGSQ